MWKISRLMPVGILIVLAGCGSPEDFGPFYQAYDLDYRKKHAFEEHRVSRGDAFLYAREFGAVHRGKAPSIVVMHGFPDSLHLYDRIVPVMAQTRHVIAFDFLGWGRSDKPESHLYDVASLRRDLEAVIGHFKLDRAVIVVHDSSGQPGIDWALDNPGRVAGLVLLNTYYGPSPTLKPPEAIERYSTPGIWRDVAVFGAMRSNSQWQQGFMKQLGKFVQDAEARRVFVRVFAHQSLAIRPAFFGLNKVLRAEVAKRGDRVKRLKTFGPPVRVVFGAGDPYLNVGVAKALHADFPGSELFLIDDPKHYVQLDQPQRVASLILGMRSRQDQQGSR